VWGCVLRLDRRCSLTRRRQTVYCCVLRPGLNSLWHVHGGSHGRYRTDVDEDVTYDVKSRTSLLSNYSIYPIRFGVGFAIHFTDLIFCLL